MRVQFPGSRLEKRRHRSQRSSLRSSVARILIISSLAPAIAALMSTNESAKASVGDTGGPKVASSNTSVWNNVYLSTDNPLSAASFPAGVRITVRVTNGVVRLSSSLPSGDSAITANSQSGINTTTGATEMDWWAQSASTGIQALRTLQVQASNSSASPTVELAAAPAAIRPSTANPDGQTQNGAAFSSFPNPVYVIESDSWFERVQRNSTNWTTARTEASNRTWLNYVPPRLASLETAEQSKTVRALLKGTNQQVWLGAADDNSFVSGSSENNWRWLDGNAWGWTTRPTWFSPGRDVKGEWHGGEPNSDSQDCLQIDWSWSASGYWDDLDCGYLANHYVVEYGGPGSNNTGYLPRLSTSRSITFTNDSTAPTITLARSGSGTLKAGQTNTITFTLSESSTNFDSTDVTVTGGTLSNFTGSGSSYTATFTPTPNATGTAALSVASSRFTDSTGNSNTASTTLNIAYDTAAPTMTITSSAAAIPSGATSTITFTATETTSTFDSTDISVTLGALSNFSGSGTTYTATFTASASTGGTASISVASSVFIDSAGNNNTASNTFTITVTNTVSSSGGRTSYVGNGTNGTNGTRYIVERFTATGSSTWTVPQGVTSLDYLVIGGGGAGGTRHGGGGGAGGVRSSVTSTGGGASPESRMTVSPGSSLTVIVGAGGTNGSTAVGSGTSGSNSQLGSVISLGGGNQFTTGGSGGGAQYNASGGSGTAGQGFAGGRGGGNAGDSNWLYAGGGGGGAGGAGSNVGYSSSTAFGGAGGAGVTNSITGVAECYAGGGAGGYSDQATNVGTIQGGKCGPTTVGGSSPRGANATAGAANTGSGGGGGGFDGGATNYAGAAGGSGLVVVRYQLPESSTPDLAADSDSGITTDNITTTRTLAFTGSAPVGANVQLSIAPATSTSDTNATTGTWTNTGSTCSANTSTGAWSCTTAELTPGVYKVRSTSTTILDGVTDTQTSTSALVVDVDTTAPTITLTRSGSTTLRAGQTDTITFTLSESSTNFDITDITVTGGTLSTFTGSGTTYTATFTPTTNTSGTAALSVTSSKFTDTAGNNNTASTTLNIDYDTARPMVTNVTSSNSDETIGVGVSVSIQVTFNDSVSVSGTPWLTLETGAVDRTALYTSGSGTNILTFVYTVQSGDISSDLDYVSSASLELNDGSITDDVGNVAVITLPTPGSAGSLGANKAIVVQSEPTQIISVRSPSGTASGAAFTIQPRLSLQDSGGSVVTADNSTIVTATVSAGATLVGTPTATAVNGIVTFANLGISGTSGTSYTITYSGTVNGNALTVATQTVTPTIGSATRIALTTQPVGDTAGALLSTQPIVSVFDSGNNVVTNSSIEITVSASGGTLTGTRAIDAVGGVATFTDLAFAGTALASYTLTFTTTDLASIRSNNFSVDVGAPTALIVTTNASGAVYGELFTTQPIVEIRDAGNNTVSMATNEVTATLSDGTIPGTTDTSVSVSAVNGVATFSGLGITGNPGNFILTYSSGALDTAVQSINLIQADQTISFTAPDDRQWSPTPFDISPTATSGLTVTLSSTTSSICTVSGVRITMLAVGTCSLTAAQSGNDFYNAATSISHSFEISLASQAALTITTTSATFGQSLTLATSGGSGDGSVSYVKVSGDCTVTGSTLIPSTAGACQITATKAADLYYTSISDTRSITIDRANQTTQLSLSSTSVTYGQTLTLLASGGDGDGAISYHVDEGTCSLINATLTPGDAGSVCKVRITRTTSANYNSTTSDPITITVLRATPVLGSFVIGSKTFGDSNFTLSDPTASFNNSPVGGTWSYTSDQTSVATISGSTATITGGGSSMITATFSPTDIVNFESVSTHATLNVNRATPTFSWLDVSTTYGDANFAITPPLVATTSAVGTWAYDSSDTAVIAIDGSDFDVRNAGSSLITATFTPANSSNFVSGGTITMTATVNQADQAPLEISSLTGMYGTGLTLTTTGGTTEGVITWTTSDDTASDCAISSGMLTTSSIGTCSVTATMAGDRNYSSVTSTTATLTIDAKPIVVTAEPKNKTYGDTDPQLTYTTPTGALVGNDTLTGSLTRVSGENVGEYTITQGTVNNTNYNITYRSAKLTIDAKPIVVTAEPKNKTYGDTDPQLTYTTPTGALVGNDTLTGSLTRNTGENVGEYTITQGTVNNTNYDITYRSAKLTIGAKPIVVTAEAKNKTYGDTDPTFTYTTAAGALVGNDTLTGSLTRNTGENVGEYTITQGTVNNTNYNITYRSAKLTIGAKPIVVTAEAKNKTYGDTDPTFTYTTAAGALVGNDTLTGSLTRNTGENVGEYTITQGTVNNTNYDITYRSAKLTIGAKPIVVTAEAKNKTYGDTDPTFTYTTAAGALVGNDTLTGSLTRDSGEDAGTYVIRRGSLTNTNYDITFNPSTFTINPAPQNTLSVTTSSITYQTPVEIQANGGSEGDLTFRVISSGTAACSLNGATLTATGNAGSTCTVTATRAATNNYLEITSSVRTITVAPRTVTVTATAKEKTYGDSDPGFTYVVTTGSLYGSDVFIGSLTREAGENVGTYNINKGTLANPNYTIIYVPAELRINQRPITIRATNKEKVFGESDPVLTYTVTSGNVIDGDVLTGSITRAVGETLGVYNITQGTLDNGNYDITFVNGTFRINGAPQTGFVLTASSYSVVYQETVTLATTGGNGNGTVTFTAQDGTGSCSIVADVLTGETAGTCSVIATKAAEGGYLEATSNVITITVDKADQTIAMPEMTDTDYSLTPITVSPTSDSGAVVDVESRTPNVCTTVSYEIHIKDSGTCTIAAMVAESRNHNAAPTMIRTFEIRAVVPYAPTITEVTPGNSTISVDFITGPSGGASITTFAYSVNDGATWTRWPDGSITSPLVITNVPNSIEAKVRIAAVNRMGSGAHSNMKTATPKSPIWEIARNSNTAFSASVETSASTVSAVLPPRPALVRTRSVSGGRRTQVTATRATRDVDIPVTHAIISIHLESGKLLARIQVRVDPTNPTTSVTVPYRSSRVKITVQFANDIGISDGGTAGANLREGSTLLGTTIDGRPRLAGTQISGGVRFAKGSSTLSSAAKAELKRTLKIARSRGGLIYVTGYANKGEIKSSWRLDSLARKRAENVSKYLISLGARQWITFYGAPSAPTSWHVSRAGHVDIASVDPDQL